MDKSMNIQFNTMYLLVISFETDVKHWVSESKFHEE